jgi:hypothetical protein
VSSPKKTAAGERVIQLKQPHQNKGELKALGGSRSDDCGHATRDAWFQSQGFISCRSFDDAASFFGVSRQEALALFSGGIPVTPQRVIGKIDNLLATRTNEQDQAPAQNVRRQAIIDDLLQGAHGPATAATAAVATAE